MNKKIQKNIHKKGQAEALEWVPRLVVMSIAVVIVVMLVRYYTSRDIQGTDTATAAYLYRIYYDGNIITYVDPETKRAYPGVIDLQKFTDNRLDTVFSGKRRNGESKIASKIILYDKPGNEIKTIYHDKKTYDQYAWTKGVEGGQGAAQREEQFLITIKDGSSEQLGRLHIIIVRPN